MTFHTRLDDCKQAYIDFTAGLEPYRSILAFLAEEDPTFSNEHMEDAQRVLFACHSILDPVIDPLPPALILSLLSELQTGYGHWLKSLHQAIEITPFETDAKHHAFLAALRMAESLIYLLHTQPSDRHSQT
ncbi:MAG: hypothetical protein KJ587_04395 [Alphaproteobacteria bacterium]|nr:hypothetical protein [Alphaproteobacteria bacterium]